MTMENLPARTSGAGPLADYSIGMRVQTREGYPGVIDDILEGPADLTTYWVTLDGGMGGGEYAEAEIWPLAAQQTASQMASEAGVERTAADDYPELEGILAERLPPTITSTAAKGDGVGTCKFCGSGNLWGNHFDSEGNGGSGEWDLLCENCGKFQIRKNKKQATSDEARDWNDPGAHEDMDGEGYLDPPYPEDVAQASEAALKLALYLPPKPPSEQSSSTTPLNPQEKQGYREGFEHGKEGLTRNPSLPLDAEFMAGYDIGWAEGVLVYRKPPDSDANTELENAQIAGTFPDALGPMRAAVDTSMTEHLRQMEARGGVVDLGMPSREAGAFLDWVSGNPQHDQNWGGVGEGYSHDWCRFRRNSHCWLSKDLNEEASKQAGYAVWNPVDRGYCFRVKWADQQKCPVGAPGPNVPGGFTDATVPWEQGGQGGGTPTNYQTNPNGPEPVTGSLDDTQHPVSGIVREYAATPVGTDFFADEADDISRAYRDMPVLDPAAAGLWAELGELCVRQAEMLKARYVVIRLDDRDPYATAEEMYADIDRGVYKVTSLHSHHPVWSVDTNVAFRIVHDLTGHTTSHSDFSLKGEVIAYQNQCQQTPEHLWPVLFTEIVAQSAYANVHHLFGEQKVGFLGLTQAEIDAHVGKVMDAPDAAYDALHQSAGLKPGDIGVNGIMTTAADDTISRGLVLNVENLDFARRIRAGQVTANDLVQALHTLNGGVGVWWALDSQLDSEDYAYGSGDPAGSVEGAIDEHDEGYTWGGCELPMILTAKRPTRNGEPWDPELHNPLEMGGLMGNSYLDDGEQVTLTEIKYSIDGGETFKTLPANGIKVRAGLQTTAAFRDGPATGEYEREFPGSRIYGDFRAALWYSKGAIGDPGGVTIHAVQVEKPFQRQGLASQLLDWMAEKFRGHFVDPGGLTDDGEKLWPAWYRSRNWARPRLPGAPHTNYILLKHPEEITNPNLKGSLITSSLHTAAMTYYHGSNADLAAGDFVKPVSQTGAKNWAQQMGLDATDPNIIGPHYSADRIYLTSDRIKAMDFGNYVYEVEPTAPVQADPEAMGEPWFYSTGPARIVRKVIDHNRAVEASTHMAAFEVTATWADVRKKAKRIRESGGVRVVASRNDEVVAHVKGDHGIYETTLRRNPGRRNVAYWHCGCKWAHYSWGRSPAYKRFEGRMCSHALALQYEAQSRNMFGREMTLDEKQPAWMDQKHVHLPGDYRRDLKRYTTLKTGTEVYRGIFVEGDLPDSDAEILRVISQPYGDHWTTNENLAIAFATEYAAGNYASAPANVPGWGVVVKGDSLDPLILQTEWPFDEGEVAAPKHLGDVILDVYSSDKKKVRSIRVAGALQIEAAQAVCPICGDVMTSQVAGMSCMRCGTLIPYVSTDNLFVTFLDEGPVMERAGDTLKERYSGEWRTKQDLYRDWLASFSSLVRTASAAAFFARVRGVIQRVLLDDSGLKVNSGPVAPTEVLYPKWHPSKGLNPNDNSPVLASLTKQADEDQCPYDASDSLMTNGVYTCENGHQWRPDDPAARVYHGDGPGRGIIQSPPAKEGSKMDIPDEYGSLFDAAVASAPLNPMAPQPRTAEWDLDVTSGFATMNDEPEPALPVTDGAEDDEEAARVAQRLAAVLAPPAPASVQHQMPKEAGFPLCAKGCNRTLSAQEALVNTTAGLAHEMCPAPAPDPRTALQRHETPEERGRRLLAYVDASLAGQEIPGPNPFAHLTAGQDDNEMRLAAERFLTSEPTQRTALKTYDLAERNAIINEGEGTTASNLDRLDISGTHYEAIEAAQVKREAVAEDEDLWMLDGDPNGPEM